MAKFTSEEKAAREAQRENDFGRFDFVKMAPLMGGISLLLMIISVGLIVFKGLNYGIDFAGGTEMQVRFDQAVDVGDLRATIEGAGIGELSVQEFGQNEFLIRMEIPKAESAKEANDLVNSNVQKVQAALKSKFNLSDQGTLRVDTVGPQVGSELKRNGLLAAFYSFLSILIYVALRFDYKFAPGAVICLVHDALLTVGLFALLGREFNIQIMAAVLTLIGYSINDTIVTFDRIRENSANDRNRTLRFTINRGINETLNRTILTAVSTFLGLAALYFIADGVIQDVAFTLSIGVIVGMYSTIFIAAPLILVMDKFSAKPATAPTKQATA